MMKDYDLLQEETVQSSTPSVFRKKTHFRLFNKTNRNMFFWGVFLCWVCSVLLHTFAGFDLVSTQIGQEFFGFANPTEVCSETEH